MSLSASDLINAARRGDAPDSAYNATAHDAAFDVDRHAALLPDDIPVVPYATACALGVLGAALMIFVVRAVCASYRRASGHKIAVTPDYRLQRKMARDAALANE